jgi:N-acyl-D-aspartate/D-glutamate deacylase
MAALLRAGLEAGAIGFTSSWGQLHFGDDGKPVPSRSADREELLALCRVVRDYPGTSLEFIPTNGPFPDWVGGLVADMSVAAERPLNWNVLMVFADTLEQGLSKLSAGDVARERGGRVVALTIPVSTSVRFSLLTGASLESLPGWGPVFALPIGERIKIFADREARSRLGDSARHSGSSLPINWPEHIIWSTSAPENQQYEGRSLGDISETMGLDPWNALCEIAVADELKTSFGTVPRVASQEDWAARVSVWRDRRAVIGASDAGAHLEMVSTFAYPTAMFAAVRDHALMPLEEAVQLVTDVPARLYGIRERGRVQEGWHADLVVFDSRTIAPEEVRMRFDLPGQQGRLYAEAIGVDHVVVNGTVVVGDARLTGDCGGRLLRSGVDTVTPSLTD